MRVTAIFRVMALATLLAWMPTTAAKFVAVVETDVDAASGASADINPAEVREITAEFRRQATEHLPQDRYSVMTSETIQSMGGAVLEECTEENCVIALGSKIGADYIVRGTISKFQTRFTLAVEMYETENGTLVASSEAIRAQNIEELFDKGAVACANMYKKFVAKQNTAQRPAVVAVADDAGQSGKKVKPKKEKSAPKEKPLEDSNVVEISGSRLGVRAQIGIGGLVGLEPLCYDCHSVVSNDPNGGTYIGIGDNGRPIYEHVGGNQIEFGPSLSGSLGVVLLSRISSSLSLSCAVQYSFYVASGEYVDKDPMYGDNPASWPMSKASVMLHSLEVPVLLRVNTSVLFGRPIYAEVGPQLGFNVYASRTEQLDGVSKILKLNLNVFECGPVGGAGLDLGRVSVGVRVYYGLLEYVQYEGGSPWSATFGVSVWL